ncbi:cytochrome c [Shewanella sp. D64]|uniref:c-type cytochrome n=1 Tax=unclassified Shewanella TaxID=196818 RepID=UPI0022BA5729|nr:MULTISPECIES: cytochrome c [unclassified Shewanella]MEC4727835.1 cytochrome c [Shewanella sp. D64]MEC4739372.1 cytochrome c [Shewanella sp. E94]WBJ98116.1 cytochrome c [Shewanella sp. MTB7]
MNNKAKMAILALVSSTVLATSVQADNFKTTDDAIEYRQSAFSLMAYNFGDMGAMLKGKKPFDAQVFAMRANNVAALAKLPLEGFIADSDKGDTEALAKVWTDKPDFDAKMKQLQKDSAALAIAAKSDDKKALKQAFMTTAKNCKGCHDAYKKD